MLKRLIFHKHLEEGESIVYAVHKHWVSILKPIFLTLLFGLAFPWLLYSIGLNTPLFFRVACGWSAFALLRLIYVFVYWYADAFLMTDKAILNVEWGGIFRNAATRMGFEDIEGVSYEINGFWPTVLGYGRISLKSVSGNVLVIDPAFKPKEVELKIMDYQQQYMKHKDMNDAGKLKQLLSEMISGHLRRESK